jgi:O-methyltransferase involved in polyketide biosynthesis
MEANLTGVPETMLWTLHNRAAEARRPDGILSDTECLRIYGSIDYDYERSFGKPDGVHAVRSKLFDDAILPWLAKHPTGTVVELGAGLETQFQRCDNGSVRWLCVDVPEAVAVRERFLPETDRCRYVARSALDLRWLDEVVEPGPVFVTAQGLFMYFEPDRLGELVGAIFDRIPEVELMFDIIPPWFAAKTVNGLAKTPHYTAPPMPWGIMRDDIGRTLRRWSTRIREVETRSYGPSRGILAATLPLFQRAPLLRNIPPAIVRAR